MSTWNRICCAIDGSAPSRAALEHAMALAKQEGAALLLVHVRSSDLAGATAFAPPPGPVLARRHPAWQMSGWVADARSAVPGRVESFERAGDPASEIVAHADEWSCDLIVLGTHARRGLRRLVLGSVAEAVVRDATCPVLVVPSRPPDADRRPADRHDAPLGSEPSGLP